MLRHSALFMGDAYRPRPEPRSGPGLADEGMDVHSVTGAHGHGDGVLDGNYCEAGSEVGCG